MSLLRSGIELVLDQSKFDLRQVANKAKQADLAIDGIADSADRAERALQGINGNVNVDVMVDTSRVDAAQTEVNNLTSTQNVDVTVDTAKVGTAQTEVNNLSDTQNVDVTATTTDADAAIADIQGKLETLQSLAVINIAMNIPTNVLNSPVFTALSDTETQVDRIAAMTGQEIPQAANVINTIYSEAWGESRAQIADVIVEMGRLGVATQDYEDTARAAFQVAAVTGEDPLEILRAMEQVVANDLAPSFQSAGDFMVSAFQGGLNQSGDFLDTIIEYSSVFKDANLGAGAFFSILETGLAGGAYNADYLIDAFKEMTNLTREEVTRMGSFGEETDRTVALGELGMIDEAEAYTAGQISGDQFAAGLLDGLRAVEDPAKQRELALAIFSPTMIENIGLPNLLAMDLTNSTELPAAWEGVAADAATILTDNLNGAFAEVIRLIETELIGALDEAFDLTERMEIAKGQFQSFINEIKSGAGLGEALEVSFGLTGADTFLPNFERVVGNLQIIFLELVRDIGTLLGKDVSGIVSELARLSTGQLAFDLKIANADEVPGLIQSAQGRGADTIGAITGASQEMFDEGNYRGAVELARAAAEEFAGENTEIVFTSLADRMANQLFNDFDTAIAEGRGGDAFDLAMLIGNPDMMQTALDLKAQLMASFESAMATGDFSAAAFAADSLNNPILQTQVDEWAAQLRASFDSAMATGDTTLAGTLAQELGDPELMTQVDMATSRVEGIGTTAQRAADVTAESMTAMSDESTDALQAISTETGNTQAAVGVAVAGIHTTLEDSKPVWLAYADYAILQIDRIGERVLYVDEQLQGLSANLTVGSTTTATTASGATPAGNARGGTATGTRLVGEEGPEFATFPSPAGIINAANTSVLMGAVETMMASMGAGGGQVINNYNFVMNNSNTMQNAAQADAFGNQAGAQLRGFN